jgi:hypothetical protein
VVRVPGTRVENPGRWNPRVASKERGVAGADVQTVMSLLPLGLAVTLALVPGPGVLPLSADQEWLDLPILPAVFALDEPQETPGSGAPAPPLLEAPPRSAKTAESEYPRLTGAVDFDAWRDKDALTRVKERAGDAFFGVPLLVPQVIVEEFLPHGLQVGPTTFLYRTSPAPKSLTLVVLDQAVFRESGFLEQVQSQGTDNPYYAESLNRSQRTILRRSLMTGFRATYSLPSMSTDMILETTSSQGVMGYALMPPALGALAYLKGIDQRFQVEDVLKGRLDMESGRDWHKAIRASEGIRTFGLELRFFELPVALVGVFDTSNRGVVPLFAGLGSSLATVTDLISREQAREFRPD